MVDTSSGLKSLGQSQTDYPTEYCPQILETFPNKFAEDFLREPGEHPSGFNYGLDAYVVELDCPEFTALCPKTKQPDFAEIKIKYTPDQKLVESKSLKLYLFSFRNHGSFHEEVVNIIARDLFNVMQPHWIEVTGNFKPRGGISINPRVMLRK